jgi:DNA sulfur modification protein DndC
MVASLVVEVVTGIPADKRKKPVSILCTDTRVEIPAIVEAVESALARIHRFSQQCDLHLEVNLLKPPPEQSFWVNIIGRGYPPPNRTFRWCTQRMKIDPVSAYVQRNIGHWGEAISYLGARRAVSSTRAGNGRSRGSERSPPAPRLAARVGIKLKNDLEEQGEHLVEVG